MANSIYFESVNSYEGRKLTVSGTQTLNNDGTSTISLTLSSVGGSVSYYSTGPTTLSVRYISNTSKWAQNGDNGTGDNTREETAQRL